MLTEAQKQRLEELGLTPDDVEFQPVDTPYAQAAPPSPKSSATGAAARSFLRGLVPAGTATAGAVAGAELLSPTTAFTYGIGPAVGALVGGGLGYLAGKTGQDKAIGASPWAQQYAASEARDMAEHSVASTLGGLASTAPFVEFAPGQTLRGLGALGKAVGGKALSEAEQTAMKAAGMNLGIGGASGAVMPLMEGRAPNWQDAAMGVGQAAIFGQPRSWFPGSPKAPVAQQPQRVEPAGILPEFSESTIRDFTGTPAQGRLALPLLSESSRQMPPPTQKIAKRTPLDTSGLDSAEAALIAAHSAPAIEVQATVEPVERPAAKTAEVLGTPEPPTEAAPASPAKEIAAVAQEAHEISKANLEAVKADESPAPPEAKVAQLEAAREQVKVAGAARNELVEKAVPERNWDLFAEELHGDLDSWNPSRNSGKADYDLMDAADRFVEFARKSGSNDLLATFKEFSRQDGATQSQLRKLRGSLKNLHGQFQPESSLTKPEGSNPYPFKVEYEYPDGTRGAVIAQKPMLAGESVQGAKGEAKVVRTVPYDRAYQMAETMPTESLLYAPVNERFLNFTKSLADRHNVNMGVNDNIRTPDGQLAAGVAFVKERLVKLNPAKAGLDTGLHEVAHVYLDDLRLASDAQERQLYQRGVDLFGGDAERLTEAIGLRANELVRNRIEGNLLGRFREWSKDFWSWVKSKWGSANSQDYKALLARRMLDAEGPVSKTSEPGSSEPQFQKSSRAHELNEEAKQQSTLGKGIEFFRRAGRSVADAVKAMGPDGEHLDEHFTQKFYATEDHYIGKYGNQGILAVHGLSKAEKQGLLSYLYRARESRGKVLGASLNEKQTAALEQLRTIFKESGEDANAAGIRVTGEDGKPRPIKLDPNYFPMAADLGVMEAMTQRSNSPEARKLKRELYEWWDKGGIKGEGATLSAQEKDAAFAAMLSRPKDKMDAGFRALEKAEGLGLPPSWRESDLERAVSRYFNRFAKKMAWFTHVEADTPENAITRTLLNATDQFGSTANNSKTLADGVTTAEPRTENDNVRALVNDALGNYTREERIVDAANRVVKTGMLQTMTGAVDFTSSVFLAAQHMGLSDYLLLPKALANIKNGIAAGYRQNTVQLHALRGQTSIEGAYAQGHLSGFAERANKLADSINTITGRDALERWGRGLLMEWGRLKALSELGHKFSNPNHSSAFLDSFFGKGSWEKFKNTGLDSVPADMLEKAAARFTESVQGTYDARNLPAWVLHGQLAPFVSLAKWNIEKANNFNKYVLTPMKHGDFKPFLMLTAATFVGGEAIEELREFATGRKPQHATWKEITEAGGEGLAHRLMATMSYSGYAGALTDIGKQIMDAGAGNTPQGFKFPLVEALANGFDRVSDASVAINRGENAADVMAKFAAQIARDNIQVVRLGLGWMSEDQKAIIAEQNKMRDLRVFQQLNGLPSAPMSKGMSNPFLNSQERRFKQTSDLAEAQSLVPELLDRAVSKSGGDPEQLARSVRGLKQPESMPYPSMATQPMTFQNYLAWLERTKGAGAAQAAMEDALTRRALSSAKGSLIPSL